MAAVQGELRIQITAEVDLGQARAGYLLRLLIMYHGVADAIGLSPRCAGGIGKSSYCSSNILGEP
jgi:hypothetical protein